MNTAEKGNVPTNVINELSTTSAFDPHNHFDAWFQAVETFRKREPPQLTAGVLLNGFDLDFEGVACFDDQLTERLDAPGTLVVAKHGKLEGDVNVTNALIDGVFKGNIIATESVVIENHALIVGDIYTPTLTIRGGAIIEGRWHFEAPREPEPPPAWSLLKGSLARVWKSRIFQ